MMSLTFAWSTVSIPALAVDGPARRFVRVDMCCVPAAPAPSHIVLGAVQKWLAAWRLSGQVRSRSSARAESVYPKLNGAA
jgi:hypothetical protein